MRALLTSLTLLSVVTALGGGASAWADSTGASLTPAAPAKALPVPTRTDSLVLPPVGHKVPSAGALLLRMRSAMLEQGSVHVDFHLVTTLYPSGESVTHLRGDVSWKLSLLHDRTVMRRTGPQGAGAATPESIDLRLVHQRVASRRQSGGWQCQSMPHIHVISTLLGLEETVLSARTADPTVSDNNQVWEVRATGYSPATGSGVVAQMIYDIARSDDTLQRVQVTGISTIEGHSYHIVATETYTHYGETVNVQLPPACVLR